MSKHACKSGDPGEYCMACESKHWENEMCKHTKGPYEVRVGEDEATGSVTYFIAGKFEDENEARANARLFSAAPEMLEALHKIATDGMTRSTMLAVYAAICKAEGK